MGGSIKRCFRIIINRSGGSVFHRGVGKLLAGGNNLQEDGSYLKQYPQAKLSGRKRYPVHTTNPKFNNKGNKDTIKTETSFRPLKKGAEFICKIRFHNLRKAEIGALLSALTFHGNEAGLFHSLGMAKPLGYGKMRLTIEEIKSRWLTEGNQKDYLEAFVISLEHEINLEKDVPDFVWARQPQIDELLTMAHEQNNQQCEESKLCYMRFDPKNDIDDFAEARNRPEPEHLKYYSEMRPPVKRVSARNVDDYVVELSELLNDNQIKVVRYMADSNFFFHALSIVLADRKRVKEYNKLYTRIPADPVCILLLIDKFSLEELKARICQLQNPDKKNKEIQKLFDGLITQKIIHPDSVPEWAKPLEYYWEDLNLTDDQLFELVEKEDNLKKRLWPTVQRLNVYIEFNHKFEDETNKSLCLEYINDFLNK